MSQSGILAMLCICSFSVVLNMQIVSPLLVDIGEEFGVTVGLAGQLVTAYAVTCTVMAIATGPLMERYSRRAILMVGAGTLAVAAAGCAFAGSFAWMLVFRVLAGFGAALVQPAVYAAVGDLFDYRRRGRAMAWVVSANTVAPILGTPIGTLLAQQFTWRSAWFYLVVMMSGTAIAIARWYPITPGAATVRATDSSYMGAYRQILSDGNARAVLLSVFAAAVLWFGWSTFLGAFFIQTFHLEIAQLAPIMIVNGLGTLIGSNLGGRLGDRLGKRMVILAVVPLVSAALALETSWIAGVWIATFLNFLVCLTNGSRFTNTTAMVSEVAPTRRVTMMALNSATMQLGSTIGSAAGGLIVGFAGYWLLGLFLAGVGLVGAVAIVVRVQEVPATA